MQRRNDKLNLTLYIVDDDEGVRSALVTLLVARGYRIQAFPSGEDFLDSANTSSPGCVLLDLRMEGMSGLQVHDELVRLDSPLKVLFLSAHGDIPTAIESTRKGAVDWLEKGLPNDVFIDKVARAMGAAERSARYLRERAEVLERWNSLTPREKDVALLVRHNWANKLIADELHIGVRAVETHRAKVYEKLWVSNPVELDRMVRDYRLD